MKRAAEPRRKACAGAAAWVALALLLVGCRRHDLRLSGDIMLPPQETSDSLRERLTEQRDRLQTVQARVEGRVAWQADLEQFASAGAAAPRRSETALASISAGLLQATRFPGEPRQTRLVATFPRYRSVLEMLAVDDLFWLRKFQQSKLFLSGRLAGDRPRPRAWTSMRPQDLGTLLFNDDLFPSAAAEASTMYMETWPDVYILHVLRIEREPEPIYSRIWIQRSDLTVRSHQLFEPDGTLVAEARFDEYKDFQLKPPRSWRRGESRPNPGMIRLPEAVMLYWPRDRVVLQLRLKYEKINEPLDPAFFAPPDPAGGAQLLAIPEE